jgi:hypothetical protein
MYIVDVLIRENIKTEETKTKKIKDEYLQKKI